MATDILNLTNERLCLAFEAAGEIEALADVLIMHGDDVVVRGMAIRLRDLAGVVMSSVGDDNAELVGVGNTLRGTRTAVEAHHG